jgi:hypothetical protein
VRIVARILSACIGIFALAVPDEAQAATCDLKVTVKQLLANKDAYANRVVCAVGVFHPQFEGDNLALNEDTVWLSFYGSGPNYSKRNMEIDRQRMQAWSRLYGERCVVIQGRFNPRQTGLRGTWEAGIEAIEDVSAEDRLACFPSPPVEVEAQHADGCDKVPDNVHLKGPPQTVAQVEAQSLTELAKEAGRVPQVPLGFANKYWEIFKKKTRDGDVLLRYQGAALGGYLLVRDGCVVGAFNTVVVD